MMLSNIVLILIVYNSNPKPQTLPNPEAKTLNPETSTDCKAFSSWNFVV